MSRDGIRELEALEPRISAWLDAAVARHAPLSFRDLRKGVQGLSHRYVERRTDAKALADALGAPARRAAFSTYYAALHFMQAFLAAHAFPAWIGVDRVVDLGAGTGAVGLGASLALAAPVPVLAVDRSGWALAEARRAGRDWGVPVRTRRHDLARGLPRVGPGDGVTAGWFLNELPERARDAAADGLAAASARGARLILLEPLAGPVAPWWDDLVGRLELDARELRARVARPRWIADMDRAAGLDHGELRARIAGPRA